MLPMKIDASPLLHVNHADDAFLRVGDKSKKLSFQDRLTLMYAKGLRYFEDEPVHSASLEDIDFDFLKSYLQMIGYSRTPEEYLLQNKRFAEKKTDGTCAVKHCCNSSFWQVPATVFSSCKNTFHSL